MSRKSKSRLAQKRRTRRKAKRTLLKKAGKENKTFSHAANLAEAHQEVNINIVNEKHILTDTQPSTSHHSKKQSSSKISPWRKAGGKVNRFKKIFDDHARQIRRSVHVIKDNQAVKILTPKRSSTYKKVSKSLIKNKKRKHIQNLINTEPLEEGEIRSDTDITLKNLTYDAITSIENNDNDDDCIVIEQTLEEITIDDDDDADFASTSCLSTNYKSVLKSFEECVSSTPCQDRKSHAVMDNPKHKNDVDNPNVESNLPFFVDVGRGTDSLNCNNNIYDNIKLSTLKERSQPKGRSLHLNTSADSAKVIDLVDVKNDIVDITLKPEPENLDDDSVIFISETNKNDFIPIVDKSIPPRKILEVNEPLHKTPDSRLRTNNLFTQSETKKINKYNENAYNPSNEINLTSGKRIVIIDGSNVAFKHGLDQAFSVKGLKIAIDYFEKMGHEVKAVIPQYRMNKTKSTDPVLLEKLHKAGKIVQTPCKNLPGHSSTSYDDRFILQLAFAMDAAIVSNDNYRDLLHENPAFKKLVENRVIGYTWCNDIFILPKDPYGKWGPTLHSILNRC